LEGQKQQFFELADALAFHIGGCTTIISRLHRK
jgi:hypothetical protein